MGAVARIWGEMAAQSLGERSVEEEAAVARSWGRGGGRWPWERSVGEEAAVSRSCSFMGHGTTRTDGETIDV